MRVKNYKKTGLNFFINLATGCSAGMLISGLALPTLLIVGNLPIITFGIGAAIIYASFMLVKELTKKSQYDLLDEITILEAKIETLEFLSKNENDNLSFCIKEFDLLALQRKRTTKSLKLAGATLLATWTLGSAVVTSLTLLKFLPASLFIAGTLSGPIGIAFLILAIAAAGIVFALRLKQLNSSEASINGKNLLKVNVSMQQLEARCDTWLENRKIPSSTFVKWSSFFYSPFIKTMTSILSTFSLFFAIGKLLAVIPVIAFVWTPPVWIIIAVAVTFGVLGGIVSYEREKELMGQVPLWHSLKKQTHRLNEKLAIIENMMTPKVEKKSLVNTIQETVASAWFEYQHSVLAQISLRKQLRQLQQRALDIHITNHLTSWLNNKMKEVQIELMTVEKHTSILYAKIQSLGERIENQTSKKFQSILDKNVFLGNLLVLIQKKNSPEELDEINATIVQVTSEIHQYVRSPVFKEQAKENVINDLASVYSLGNN